MKSIVLALCGSLLSLSVLSGVGGSTISFYEVPLVCNAAPDIACGSRVKPILLEMEKNAEIEEAWINRSGTVYAIVWKEKDRTKKVAQPIFKSNGTTCELIKQSSNHLEHFREKGEWYNSETVDELSIEEAATIAETATSFLVEDSLITKEEATPIKQEIQEYFEKELVKVRTLDQLIADEKVFRENIIKIYVSHLGQERVDEVLEKYGIYESRESKSCEETCGKKKVKRSRKKSCCEPSKVSSDG